MEHNPMDPEILASAFSGAEFPEDEDLGKGDALNAMDQFIEDAKLAGTFARPELGWAHVERFREQTAQLKRAAVKAASTPAAALSVTDESLLEKRESFRFKWISDRMARFSKSASEVIDDWCQEFPTRRPEIEAELRAVAAHLDAA